MEYLTKLLKDLNPNKASGPDELTPRILKELHEEIAPAVTFLFQKISKPRTNTHRLETCLCMPYFQERSMS